MGRSMRSILFFMPFGLNQKRNLNGFSLIGEKRRRDYGT